MSAVLRSAVLLGIAVDPFGAAVVCAAIDTGQRRSRAVAGWVTATALLYAAVVLARPVLDWLHITPTAAQLAAGSILVVPAATLLWRGDSLFLVPPPRATARRFAPSPIGVPLLAGPAPVALAAAFAVNRGQGETAMALALVAVVAAGGLALAVRSRRPRATWRSIVGRFVGAAMVGVAFDVVYHAVLAV